MFSVRALGSDAERGLARIGEIRRQALHTADLGHFRPEAAIGHGCRLRAVANVTSRWI